MYRYFFKTEEKEPGTHIHDVNDYKLPDNDELSDFLEKRKKDIIGHTSTLYHIRAGEIININNCKCGLKEKHFLVHGRTKESEIRGCSDI